MKKLLLLAVVVAGGIFGYTHFLNAKPASPDEKILVDLERRFDAATQQMMRANSSAGATGMDTTSDVEAARSSVRRIEGELESVKGRLKSDAARQRADRLQEKVRAFRAATD
jgi:hypothetical protein